VFRAGSLDERDLVWLGEFLCPPFSADDERAAVFEINLNCDDASFHELMSYPGEEQGYVNGFILDTHIVKFQAFRAQLYTQVFYQEDWNLFYKVSKDRRQLEIIAETGNINQARTAMMRVIREYAVHGVQHSTGSFLHGAAVVHGDKGFLIAGVKNAGKTSLLNYLLSEPKSIYVSNDRVLVYEKNGRFRAHGVPTIISLTRQTIAMFPALQSGFMKQNYHHAYSLRELKAGAFQGIKDDRQEIGLTPRQFCHLVNTPLQPDMPLNAVLFPKVSEQYQGIRVNAASGPRALELLREAQLSKQHSDEVSLFHIPPAVPPAHTVSGQFFRVTERLASQVPCYECQIEKGAYLKGYDPLRLIEQLAEQTCDGVMP
jgi:hypothetical protein